MTEWFPLFLKIGWANLFIKYWRLFLFFLKLPPYNNYQIPDSADYYFFYEIATNRIFLFYLPFVFILPIILGIVTKRRQIVKKYWIFSALLDFFLLIIAFTQKCKEGFIIAFCPSAKILGIIFFIIVLIIRSFSLGVVYLLVKNK